MDAETFEMSFFETFTTITTDNRTVELEPGGSERAVTFENRTEFCDMVERYRLHEFDLPAAAVRAGLATMVPGALLSITTGAHLERMVCGNPEVDIDLLEECTQYEGCDKSSPHVRWFWRAMREFSTEEREALIKFTWGRSRLPLKKELFDQLFKIQNFDQSPADGYYPVAHTCFFSLELPAYSCFEVLKEKLLYAIFNCQSIDGDDTGPGQEAAMMGFET
jgi:hypothetical protein